MQRAMAGPLSRNGRAEGQIQWSVALLLLSVICCSRQWVECTPISPKDSNSTEDIRKCMKYSWVGKEFPSFFNVSSDTNISLTSCDAFPHGLAPKPCVSPFVITQGNLTNLAEHLAVEYGELVECVPREGETCAEVTFIYYDKVVNMTTYCTRVIVDQSEPLTSGCETAQIGAFTNTVCVKEPSKRPWLSVSNASRAWTNMQIILLTLSHLVLFNIAKY